MKKYVLDCSAAMHILLKKEKAELYYEMLYRDSWVLAPDLFRIEMANTLWKYVKAGQMTEDEAQLLLSHGLSFVNQFVDTAQYMREAMHEGIRLNHSVYDMLYFTLARHEVAMLLTCDNRLVKLAASEGVGTA